MKIDLDNLPDDVLAKFLLTEGGTKAYERFKEIKMLCTIAGIPCEVEVTPDDSIDGIEIDEASIEMTGEMWKKVMEDIKNLNIKEFRGATPDDPKNPT